MEWAQQSTNSLVNKQLKRAFLGFLSQLQHGFLQLQDEGEFHEFGDPACELKAKIVVHDPRFYRNILLGGSIAAGESWVEGLWSSPDLVNVVRLIARNLPQLDALERRFGWLSMPINKLRHWMNRNTPSRSRVNIAAHYDLGNDLYQLFLDEQMQYSSAIYPTPHATLSQAQQHKLHTICERLALQPDDHLLEIGTGWGGLALYAATHYGCKVTTTTISNEQYHFARKRIEEQGLTDRITLLQSDYRDLRGQFDKVVSIEMIEAVGKQFLPSYFEQLSALVKPGGRMLLQAITMADARHCDYADSVDFIQRYIFPGGFLPSLSQMTALLARTDLQLVRLHDYGFDYARTLKQWSERFLSHAATIRDLGYSQDFIRLWHFYFAYCEGGFWERTISLVHFEAIKPAITQNPCKNLCE
ncbi:MAG: class I SAM-dependent methyltransferase [Enterovibrio sp.]